MKQRDRDNLNPIPEAVFAMRYMPNTYARQIGGAMDFLLDYLDDREQAYCVESVIEILKAAKAHKRI